MALQLDKSLYTKVNKETRAVLAEVNREAIALGFGYDDPDWGLQITLRQKQNYLARRKAMMKEAADE